MVCTEPVEACTVDQLASLRELVADMAAAKVSLILVLGGNPVYNAHSDLPFAAALDQVPLRVHLGLYPDETAERCHWHLAEAHSLEAWSDARAWDGTASIVQPLIAPLYGGKSAHEVLSAFLGRGDRTGYEIVRDHWKGVWGAGEFEARWQKAVHDGLIAGTAAPEKAARM